MAGTAMRLLLLLSASLALAIFPTALAYIPRPVRPCPATPTELCDFYFDNFENQIPVFNDIRFSREVELCPLQIKLKGLTDRKMTVETGDGEFLKCGSHDCSKDDPKEQFYLRNKEPRLLLRAYGQSKVQYFENRCILLPILSAQLPRSGADTVKLQKGDGNKRYTEARRCIVFKTGPKNPCVGGPTPADHEPPSKPSQPAEPTYKPAYEDPKPPNKPTEPTYKPAHEVPESTYEAFKPIDQDPKTTYQDPKPTYQDPKPTYEDPNPTYQDSTPTYKPPASENLKPTYKPTEPTYKPTYQEPKPPYQDPNPTYQDSKPAYRDWKPTHRDSKPSYKRTYEDPKPTYKPTEPPYRPTTGAPKPKPSKQEPTPYYQEHEPTYEDAEPTFHDPQPTYEDPTHQDPEPTYEDPTPTYQQPDPMTYHDPHDDEEHYDPAEAPVESDYDWQTHQETTYDDYETVADEDTGYAAPPTDTHEEDDNNYDGSYYRAASPPPPCRFPPPRSPPPCSPPPPRSPPPCSPPPPRSPPPCSPPPCRSPPPRSPPPCSPPPPVKCKSICPGKPLSLCDFYFKGFRNVVPTLKISSSGVISPAIEHRTFSSYTRKPAAIRVDTCHPGRFLGCYPQTDRPLKETSLTQFYFKLNKLAIKPFKNPKKEYFAERCVLLPLTRVQMPMDGSDDYETMASGEASSYSPEERRCIVFRTKLY